MTASVRRFVMPVVPSQLSTVRVMIMTSSSWTPLILNHHLSIIETHLEKPGTTAPRQVPHPNRAGSPSMVPMKRTAHVQVPVTNFDLCTPFSNRCATGKCRSPHELIGVTGRPTGINRSRRVLPVNPTSLFIKAWRPALATSVTHTRG